MTSTSSRQDPAAPKFFTAGCTTECTVTWQGPATAGVERLHCLEVNYCSEPAATLCCVQGRAEQDTTPVQGAVHAVIMQNRLRHAEEKVHDGEVQPRETFLSDPEAFKRMEDAARYASLAIRSSQPSAC
jgi:hypothetical protein